MSLKVVVLACLLALATAICDGLTRQYDPLSRIARQSRIVGGDDAEVGEFPHQVSLQTKIYNKVTHFCGGSIINEEWILTAGHCVMALEYGMLFLVKAGKHNINYKEQNEQVAAVEKSFVHERYRGNTGPYDIALLKLKTPLKFNKYVQPIVLPEFGVEPVGDVTVSGWGWISTTITPEYPEVLQHVTVQVIDRKVCNASVEAMNNGFSPLHHTNICTGPLTSGRGGCKGDSGGPLISSNKQRGGVKELIGVVSWGFVPCGAQGSPTVFVKVADFVNWIQSTITNNTQIKNTLF